MLGRDLHVETAKSGSIAPHKLKLGFVSRVYRHPCRLDWLALLVWMGIAEGILPRGGAVECDVSLMEK